MLESSLNVLPLLLLQRKKEDLDGAPLQEQGNNDILSEERVYQRILIVWMKGLTLNGQIIENLLQMNYGEEKDSALEQVRQKSIQEARITLSNVWM